jgi:hypothetical protein
VTHVVGHLFCKTEALNSNPNPTKKTKNKTKKEIISAKIFEKEKLYHVRVPIRHSAKERGQIRLQGCLKEGPDFKGSLLREVDLQLNLEEFKK